MRTRICTAFAAFTLLLTGLLVVSLGTASTAEADECFTWSGTLSSGASGAEVTELQIRVAGWAGTNMAIDGSYGPQTAQAVAGFQSAYGLAADGVAGPATFDKIYELQDPDCSPIHFDWAEVAGGCGEGGYSGGAVDAATVQENLKRVMWRVEALRHQLGDKPLSVMSGFRSIACNASVGGATDSQHLYGTAMDLVATDPSLCAIAQQARTAGFGGIFGPGYPGHSDHVHVDIRPGAVWSAPECGI